MFRLNSRINNNSTLCTENSSFSVSCINNTTTTSGACMSVGFINNDTTSYSDERLRHAASIIQNAYRQYRLKKNYFKICADNVRRRSLEMPNSSELFNDVIQTHTISVIKDSQDQKLPSTASNSCSSVHSYFSSSTTSSVSTSSTTPQPPPPPPAQTIQQQIGHRSSSSLRTGRLATKNYDRKFLIGLNLFNHKPDKGIRYLVDAKYLEYDTRQVAEFLLRTKFLSKQMIGEYVSNCHDLFVKQVLADYCKLMNFKNLAVDEALRVFQSHFRMPGEAQKIEYLTHTFSYFYIEANQDECKRIFKCAEETIDVLAYAIIILNTTIHNPNVKSSEKMKFEQFVKMTKGIDGGSDIDTNYLLKVYERVKQNEFKADKDHVNVVIDFERNLVGTKKPSVLAMALPHRRLICYVQLYEIYDLTKKEKSNQHQRDVFLFNDLLVVTKVFSKKKSNTLYTYRCSYPLHDMDVYEFKTDYYQFGIRLLRLPEKKVLITLNARNTEDQKLFCKDLSESIAESNEIECILRKDTKISNGGGGGDDDNHRASISSSGIGSSCSTRSSTGNLNTNIKHSSGLVKSSSINSIHELTCANQLLTAQVRAGSDSSINKIGQTPHKTIKRDNHPHTRDHVISPTAKKINEIECKLGSKKCTSKTPHDHKYFTLSAAATTKKNLDKSLYNVFKYVGLYGNYNSNNDTTNNTNTN